MYPPKYIALVTITAKLFFFTKSGYSQEKNFSVFLDPPLLQQSKLIQQVNLAYGGGDTLAAVMQMTLTDGRNIIYTTTYTAHISSNKTAYSLEWKPSGFRGTGLYDLYKNHGFLPYSDALRYELMIVSGTDTFRYAQRAEASRIIPSDHPLIAGFLSYYDRKMSRRVRPSYGRLVRSYFESEGFTVTVRYMDGERYLDIYHLSAYIGSYKHNTKSKTSSQRTYDILPDHMTFDVLSHHDALKKDRADQAISGTLYSRSQVSTGREEHSSIDNNYTEVGGSIQVPVLGIPFTVNGMYTTQDRHRNFKSSYINFSFDRSGLLAQLEEQQAIYSDNADKVKNAGAFAGSRVQDQLQAAAGARDRILGEIRNELSIIISRMADSTTARSGVAGTSYEQYAGMYKDPATIRPEQLDCAGCDTVTLRRLEKIGRLAQQLETYNATYEAVKTKYTALQDKRLADSLQIDHFTQRYYDGNKPLQEQLPGLTSRLPNGRLKKWATRLTNFDAGMLSNYYSDYTLAGQMTKGLDAGYDFKYFKAGTNLGYTDYLSPDGSVLRYKTGLGKLVFNPSGNQDVQLSYFAYAPLQKQDIPGYGGIKGSYGGLLDAAHNRTDIFSALYAAEWDRLTLKLDYSQSKTAAESMNFRNLDNSAFNVQAGLRYIPDNDLQLAYEHMGRAFENRVLPFLFSGTRKIKLQNTGIYFQNKIRVRLEYQLLLQSSAYYSGRNRKLGAEIQTRFKRLPNLTVAYKPFTTFRTLTDTFQVQQRPMMGDVCIVKANYILKTGSGGIYTFNTFYNYNRSQVDTARYSSSNIQLMAAYVRKGWTVNATAGYVGSGGDVRESMSGSDQVLLFNNTFETLQLSGQLLPILTAGGGLELAHAGSVIVRSGLNIHATLAPKNWPLQFNAMVRRMRYNKALTTGNPGMAAFSLGIYYTFSTKKRPQ